MTINNYIIHSKETELFCQECGELFMVLKKDIRNGDIFTVDSVYADRGQAPFISGSEAVCKCGVKMNRNNLKPIRLKI